jgi:hypothetical protein
MSKFIQFDDSNVLSARYDSDIHGENIPESAIQVSEDLFHRTMNETDGIWSLVDNEVVKLPFPPPSIEQLRADKAADIDLACRNAIYAGFTSNALGAVYHYPAKDKDQSNLVGSVTESLYPNLDPEWVTPFWCATDNANGVWAYRAHTAAQIQQVGTDAKAAIVAALTYNAQLQAQIAVADAEGLAAIVWNPPA